MKKIIHYFYDKVDIWEMSSSPSFRMCYASWLKFCPDYEIKLWHTEMPEFKEILKNSRFVRECYKRKLWAYIADYIRYYALYNYGGIYLDTDVQLLKNFDEFLDKKCFVSIENEFYKGKNIAEPAVIGGEKEFWLFKEMIDLYNSDKIFEYDNLIAPIVLTSVINKTYKFDYINYTSNEKFDKLKEYLNKRDTTKETYLDDYDLYKNQLPIIDENNGLGIYPSEYFCPGWNALGEKAFTDKTVAIHWNQSSWWKDYKKLIDIKSLRYKNPVKRFFYRKAEHFAKLLTMFIPVKSLRRSIREKIVK